MITADIFHMVVVIFVVCTQHFLQAAYIRACLYKSVARHRTNAAKFTIRDIDFTLCTYYFYGYAKVEVSSSTIRSVDSDEEGPGGQYSQFNEPKNVYFYTRTILSVGGPGAASDQNFQNLAAKDIRFTDFTRNAVKYLRDNRFDGLDIHWEFFPADIQKNRLTKLLEALRNEFEKEPVRPKLLLTVTVIGMTHHADRAYDVPGIQRFADYACVMAFDLIFNNNTFATFRAPLFYRNHPDLNPTLTVDYTIRHWHDLGLIYDKIIVGVSVLGHYLRLVSSAQYEPGAPTTADILAGPVYGMPSRLAFPEICMMMTSSRTYYDTVQCNAYLVRGSEWVGYEDELSVGEKFIFMKTVKAAGLFFSAFDEDDFSGQSCNSGKYPLLSYLKALFEPVFENRTRRTTKQIIRTSKEEYTHFTTSTPGTVTVSATIQARQGFKMRNEDRSNSSLQYYILLVALLIIICCVGYIIAKAVINQD